MFRAIDRVTGRTARTLAVMGVSGLLVLSPLAAQPTERTISGTVQDRQHEPLRGAVVQIESETTSSIESYITDQTGHYRFKRLSSDQDYKVWSTYRGKRSPIKSISHFDEKPDRAVDLIIELD